MVSEVGKTESAGYMCGEKKTSNKTTDITEVEGPMGGEAATDYAENEVGV